MATATCGGQPPVYYYYYYYAFFVSFLLHFEKISKHLPIFCFLETLFSFPNEFLNVAPIGNTI